MICRNLGLKRKHCRNETFSDICLPAEGTIQSPCGPGHGTVCACLSLPSRITISSVVRSTLSPVHSTGLPHIFSHAGPCPCQCPWVFWVHFRTPPASLRNWFHGKSKHWSRQKTIDLRGVTTGFLPVCLSCLSYHAVHAYLATLACITKRDRSKRTALPP